MKIRLKDLQERAKSRPEGYYEKVVSMGTVENDVLNLDSKAYLELLKIYDPASVNTVASNGCTTCGKQTSPNPQPVKPQPQLPSLKTQVKNAASAASRVISNIVHNRPIKASDEIIAKRREICTACDKYDSARGRCLLCGCMVKWKITLASEKCPFNPPKW